MTVRRAILLLSLAPATAAASNLCDDRARSIEPDMQIQEADLTTQAAQEAVVTLQKLVAAPNPDELSSFAMLNRLQVLRGYSLRQQALEDRSAHGPSSTQAQVSTDAFCSWLAQEAFWYD